jgi:methyl-accepting chemotaxis protein
MFRRILPSNLTIRGRLTLLAAVAISVALLIGATSVTGDVLSSRAEQRVALLNGMFGSMWNADMMHDGLRGDAMSSLVIGMDVPNQVSNPDQVPGVAKTDALNEIAEHSKTFREAIDSANDFGSRAGFAKGLEMLASLKQPLDEYIAAANELATLSFEHPKDAQLDRPKFEAAFRKLETALASAEEVISGERDRITAETATLKFWIMVVHIAASLFAAAFVAIVSLTSYRAIVRPLAGMCQVIGRLAEGNQREQIPAIDRKDEIGEIARALTVIRDTGAQVARVQTAVDSVSSNVMIADNDGKIVYMNKGTARFLKDAEAEFRKDLPHFDVSKIVGQNIDIFHKNPAHQRNLLANLKSTYSANVRIGGRPVRLVANPAIAPGGDRVGSVVEWVDVRDEIWIETEMGGIATAAMNGDLAKRIDLTGRTGIYQTAGQGMNRLLETVGAVMAEISAQMSAMAQGDLSKRISGDYQGAFLKLKTDANATAEKLGEIVGQTVDGMANIKASTAEISGGATDLSSRTEQQVASLEQIAASIRQLNTTVQQSAENAGQATQLSVAARTAAESGGEVANTAIKAMGEIEQSSRKISDIVGMIDEIAFQTNLLALNAAVEAARAGEAGRGFAVVAGEVRTLAQRASQASKEIKTLISNSNSQVKQGVELVNKAGVTLGEIVTSVKRVSDIVAEIAAANREQSASVGEVQEAIGQVEQTTQQNAALVEETTAALGSADNQVQSVTDVISFFKSGALTAATPAAPSSKGAKAVQAKLAAKVGEAKPNASLAKSSGGRRAATGTDDGWQEF